MIQYFDSGYINLRSRKLGIVFTGESAQHIMDNYMLESLSHPFKHIKIQQLAKAIKDWKKEGKKRYAGIIIDTKTKIRVRIIIEVYTRFAIIITCYKY